jgi:hypothetical protein
MLLDASVVRDTYIEDCEVCCNPIEVHFAFEASALTTFSAESIEQ